MGKVLLGYKEPIMWKKTASLLLFDIVMCCIPTVKLHGRFFFQITSASMRRGNRHCFGRCVEAVPDDSIEFLRSVIVSNGGDPDGDCTDFVAESNKLSEFFFKDATFWISFIEDYVANCGEIYLLHYRRIFKHIENPLLELPLEKLNANHLFLLKENQTIRIYNPE